MKKSAKKKVKRTSSTPESSKSSAEKHTSHNASENAETENPEKEETAQTKDEALSEIGTLEKMGTSIDSLRSWLVKAYRMGLLMAKGAYIVGERKKLFGRLGEQVYYKISKGELRNAELEPLVQQLDKLTKKVEIEEILIRSLRFGKRPAREKSKRNAKEKA